MVEKYGVTSNFRDFTDYIRASSLSSLSFAGAFSKGIMEKTVTITNLGELEQVFGIPTPQNRVSFLMARQCLLVSQNLKIRRIATTGSLNATSDGNGLLVKNRDHYENSFESGEASSGNWVSKTAGSWGNSIKVSICPADSTAFNAWDYKTSFRSTPSTSEYVDVRGGTLDEMHIVVVDVTGDISGTPNTVIEKFEFVSQASDALGLDGETNYYKNVINNTSAYVYWLDHPTTLTDAGSLAESKTFTVVTSAITETLSGGVTSDTVSVANYQTAYDALIDDKLNRVDVLVSPPLPDGADGITLANYILAKAKIKKDFVVALSPPVADTLNVDSVTAKTNIMDFRASLTPTMFATMDSTSVKVFDKYNGGTNVAIPGSSNLAATLAYTYRFADVATSNAGVKRGQYFNITNLSYDPSDADQGDLVSVGINPVISSLGRGIYLNGDNTLIERASAFDQVSVVSTFIALNRAISEYAENYLFEKNDSITDILFRQDVETFLKDQVQKRIISQGRITKGTSSNPNEYVGNIFIVPINSIRYITLNFVAVKGQGTSITTNEGVL